MGKSKRYQSGREIFEHYIPNYVPDDDEFDDVTIRAHQLADAILSDFASGGLKTTEDRLDENA